MQNAATETAIRPAVLSRGDGAYLRLGDQTGPVWVKSPWAATAFPSMRDAARAAIRLPSALRAFGLPLDVELELAGGGRRH
jgi:hypothetical protein